MRYQTKHQLIIKKLNLLSKCKSAAVFQLKRLNDEIKERFWLMKSLEPFPKRSNAYLNMKVNFATLGN